MTEHERERKRERRWTGDYAKVPSRDPNLDAIEDPQTEARLQLVWNTLLRAYDSEQWDEIDERAVELAFFDVVLNPGTALSSSEIENLERFESVLGNDRDPDRDWANLTAVETSYMSIVQRGVQRLRADPLGNELTPISEFMADDETDETER